jgi:hypothetical protein
VKKVLTVNECHGAFDRRLRGHCPPLKRITPPEALRRVERGASRSHFTLNDAAVKPYLAALSGGDGKQATGDKETWGHGEGETRGHGEQLAAGYSMRSAECGVWNRGNGEPASGHVGPPARRGKRRHGDKVTRGHGERRSEGLRTTRPQDYGPQDNRTTGPFQIGRRRGTGDKETRRHGDKSNAECGMRNLRSGDKETRGHGDKGRGGHGDRETPLNAECEVRNAESGKRRTGLRPCRASGPEGETETGRQGDTGTRRGGDKGTRSARRMAQSAKSSEQLALRLAQGRQ